MFKKAHFLKSVVSSNFKRLSFPFKISYALTYRCNLRCRMCNIWRKDIRDGELSIAEVEDFFRKANRFSWLGFTGGEPFLRPDLPEITDIAMERCRALDAIHFATNAQLKDDIIGIVERIRSKNRGIRTVFTVSIDGPPDLHDRIRGEQGVWKKAVGTFLQLKKMQSVKAQIGFTLSSQNIGSFEDTLTALKDVYSPLRFDDITVNIFQRSSFYYENQDMPALDPDKVKAEIVKIQKMDRDRFSVNNFLRRRYLDLYIKYLDIKKCPLECRALSSMCFLDPYGNLFPCAVHEKKLVNIRDMNGGLETLWDSNHAKSLSHECSHNLCPGCWSPCDAYSTIAGSLLRGLGGINEKADF